MIISNRNCRNHEASRFFGDPSQSLVVFCTSQEGPAAELRFWFPSVDCRLVQGPYGSLMLELTLEFRPREGFKEGLSV